MAERPASLLDEVRTFLTSLPLELPLLFTPKQQKPKPAAAAAAPGRRKAGVFPYKGKDLALCAVEAPHLRRSEIAHESDGLILMRGADRAAPQEVLREWLIDRARETFAERAAHWAQRLGVSYKKLSIRDQKSVWGSCTRAGDLSFNWRVIMAPPETLDYLVIHELSHLHEMNHSKKFWAHVASQCPDWKAQRRWLRDHSVRLKKAVRRAS